MWASSVSGCVAHRHLYPTPPARNRCRWHRLETLSGLDLTADQAFEVARAVERLDVAEAADRAAVYEEVGHRLPVGAVGELLEGDARRAVGRVDDVDEVAPARQEAPGTPAAEGASPDVENHLSLLRFHRLTSSRHQVRAWSQERGCGASRNCMIFAVTWVLLAAGNAR